MQLWDIRFQYCKSFFDNLVDKYRVTIVHDVTHNRFIATCKYLADNTDPAKELSSTFLVMVMMDVSSRKTTMAAQSVSVGIAEFCLNFAMTIARKWKE